MGVSEKGFEEPWGPCSYKERGQNLFLLILFVPRIEPVVPRIEPVRQDLYLPFSSADHYSCSSPN
jgi:hypothetical protein